MPDARADAPSAGDSGERPVSPLVRGLDLLAGLLAAGLQVVGGLLLLAQLLAPSLLSLAGWGQAGGPGWSRVAAHLVVGVGGELVVRFRTRLGAPARATADTAVVVAGVALIAWAWWP
jgi:uncharacterized membrane protein